MKQYHPNYNLVGTTVVIYIYSLIISSFSIDSNNLSLSKELISNTISIVHLQSTLMIMASERDFPFDISNNSTLNYIRHPRSYRTTLIQISSDMQKIFSNTYSTMYRLQLDVKRIPNYIKIILKLLRQGSSSMIKRMLPRSLNNIIRISNENKNSFVKTINEFTGLFNLLNEVQHLSLKFNNNLSNKTDLMLYHKFDLKTTFEKIGLNVQEIIKQFEDLIQSINLDIKTDLNLSDNENIMQLIPVLYSVEINAYFLYQLSDIYTDILNRYVLHRIAGIGRYVTLSTDEERYTALSNISEQLITISHKVEKIFRQYEYEFQTNSKILQEEYEKLVHEFQDRSLTSKTLE